MVDLGLDKSLQPLVHRIAQCWRALHSRFRAIDFEGTGKVSYEEFMATLRDKRVDEGIELAQVSGSSRFHTALAMKQQASTPSRDLTRLRAHDSYPRTSCPTPPPTPPLRSWSSCTPAGSGEDTASTTRSSCSDWSPTSTTTATRSPSAEPRPPRLPYAGHDPPTHGSAPIDPSHLK